MLAMEKNGGVRADADRERERGGDRKQRTTAEQPEAVVDVLKSRLKHGRLTRSAGLSAPRQQPEDYESVRVLYVQTPGGFQECADLWDEGPAGMVIIDG